MTRPPVVSVLMTVYNHERFIVEAIEGALAQARDYPAECLDFVLVDDGSTDGTPALVERYRHRIRTVRKPNGGALSTVNAALGMARGELLCFLSGDDVWLPGKIARQAAIMAARPELTLLYGDVQLIDGDSAVTHDSYYALHPLPILRGDVRGPLLDRQFLAAPSVMLRAGLRERFFPIGPPAAWEDWWMYHHGAQAGPVDFAAEPDALYRIHDANLFAGATGEDHLRLVRRELPFRRWLLTHDAYADVRPADLLAALRTLEAHAAQAGVALPRDTAAAEARTAEAVAALERDDPAAATRLLAQAVALDASHDGARRLLDEAAAVALAPVPGARSVALLASAEELLADPALLEAYAQAFGAGDDVTLLVHAPGRSAQRAATELGPLADRCGINAPGGPDVVVRCDGPADPGQRVAGLLSRGPAAVLVPGAPRVETAGELRRLGRLRRTQALRPALAA